jgi:nucleotide-binding universal stress UspA family protein
MPRNTVLIPMDGSAFSESILPVVRRFLRPEENELILYQVAEPPDGGTGGIAALVASDELHDATMARLTPAQVDLAMHPIYTSQVEEGVAAKLEDKLLLLAQDLRTAGYTVMTEVGFGDPAPEVEEFIQSHAIDLVAMTTHGRTGLQRALLGSVAEQILRHVSIPILLLHPFEYGSSI